MTKILSPTAQINLLKRLRRMCPFAVWSGQYGYDITLSTHKLNAYG